MKKWSVLSSERVVHDQWLTLRADRCQRDDGRIIEPYYVVERPDWVCILAVTAELNVVLTNEYRHGAGVIGKGFPGGNIEASDRDPLAAAARELREETGYVCDALEPIGTSFANWSNHSNVVHYFLGLGARRVGDVEPDANEQIEVLLTPLSDVMRKNNLRQSHHLACLQLAQARLAELLPR